jgi:hypothetical protein
VVVTSAVVVFSAVVVVVCGLAVADWRQPEGLGDGLLGNRHSPRQSREGWGEVEAADQQQICVGDLGFLVRSEPEVVGIIGRLEQTAHGQFAAGQPLGEIAENPIGGHHPGVVGGRGLAG